MRLRPVLIGVLGWLLPTALTAQQTATFTGAILDSIHRPIDGAVVSITDLEKVELTDKNGAFRMVGVAPGRHPVSFWRTGYGRIDTSIVFPTGGSVARYATLGRVTAIDSLPTIRTVRDSLLADFDRHSASGSGKFMTRAEIDQRPGMIVSVLLDQMQGPLLIHGPERQDWVAAKKAPLSRCAPITYDRILDIPRATEAHDSCLRSEHVMYVPEADEQARGITTACYSLVYIDRQPVNAGPPTKPFNANTLTTSQIQDIEWYANADQAHSAYPHADARCGLLVFHMRHE